MSTDSFLATMAQIIFRLVELQGIDAQHCIRNLGGDPVHFRDPSRACHPGSPIELFRKPPR